jgi:hypothetical protein
MNDWPPDWRTAKANAAEAVVIRLGVVLAELDELEQLLADDPDICSTARQLAGRIRTRRDELRTQCETLRAALGELAA